MQNGLVVSSDLKLNINTPLFPQSTPPEKKAISVSKKETTATLLMGAIGSLSSLLYLKPSQVCATLPNCGEWLSNLTSQGAASGILFSCGAFDFGAMNFFFAMNSVPRFKKFIQNQPTTCKKITYGTLLTTYGLAQSLQPLLISLGTHAETWQVAITVIGTTPGIMFSAINIAEEELPFLYAHISHTARKLYDTIANCFCNPSDEARLIRSEYQHYTQQQTRFLSHLNANWLSLLQQIPSTTLHMQGESGLGYLFERGATPRPSSYARSLGKGLFATAGVAAATGILAPIYLNTLHMMQQYSSKPGLQATGTIAVSTSITYLATKILLEGSQSAFELIDNLLYGDPINSLVLHLRPKTTIAVSILSFITAALSHATLEVLYENSYHGPHKEDLKWGVILGIDLYHYLGLMHLYNLVFERLTRSNPETRALFELERRIKHFNRMSVNDFMPFAKNLDEAQSFHIEKSNSDLLDVHVIENASVNSPSPEKKPNPSWWNWCCSWFQRKPPAENYRSVPEHKSPTSGATTTWR